MNILSCGIDVHYKQSNFYFINEATKEACYRVVPTSRIPISKMIE